MKQALLFRFDASQKIGIGHAFRCMALIEQLSLVENVECLVIAKPLPEFIIKRLQALNAQLFLLAEQASCLIEFAQFDKLSEDFQTRTLVLDGYQFSGQYRQQLSALMFQVIAFDDTNDLDFLYCDVVINALPFAQDIGYQQSAPQAKHLIGLDYSIIRQEFLRSKKRSFHGRQKLLINFGGSDIGNLTLPLIEQLIEKQHFTSLKSIIVITGGAYCESKKVRAIAKKIGFTHIHNCQNMAEILPDCKVAICAPGAIVYELAYCGVPSIFLTVADNQLLSARAHQDIGWCKVENGLDKQGIAFALQHLEMLWHDDGLLSEMSDTAQRLIDGQGVNRICGEIKGMLE